MNVLIKNTNFILKRAFIYIALFIFMYDFSFCYILPNVQSKSIWVSEKNLLDSLKIDSLLTFSKKNDLNKIFVKVRDNGESFYKSDITYNYQELDSLFDPLDYLIKMSSGSNIEIHAWLDAYLLWNKQHLPENKQHYYYLCPDCLESDINGKSDGKIELNKNQSKNWEGVFISPIHPEVNDYLLLIIKEIINNYDIDGINLDYLRYQDSFFGYNSKGIDTFINQYEVDPRDINRGLISERFGYSESFIDTAIYNWDNFRTSKITELVRSVKYSILNDSLDVHLSASVKPNYYNAKFRWYQDWMSWIEENIIDFVIIKNFSSDLSEFNVNNKLISYKLDDYTKREKIYIGLSAYESPSILSDKILLSRLQGYENFSIYEYDISIDSLKFYDPIFNVLNFKIN